MVLLAVSGKIFVFAVKNPMAIQKKSVSIGVNVARKVVIFIPHINSNTLYSHYDRTVNMTKIFTIKEPHVDTDNKADQLS